jgi:hypothetical protein
MNQELEENRIKELFHELKLEEEGRAPAFARVMEAARLRAVETRQPLRVLTIAVATALLVLAISSLLVIKQLSPKTAPVERAEAQEPPAESVPPAVITDVPDKNESLNNNEAMDKNKAPKPARRRVTRRPRQAATLISGWRSPTDFLLNTSGQQLLRATPRLGESIVNIEGFFLDEKN